MIRSRLEALEDAESNLASILRWLTNTANVLELGDTTLAEQARGIHQQLVALHRSTYNSIHLKPVIDLFEYPDAEFVAQVSVQDGWWHWPYNEDHCEWFEGRLTDLDQEERTQVMECAREWFVAAYGQWFVDMGFARWPEEVWSIVQSVSHNVDEERQFAELRFFSKKMAAMFRLAHSEQLV